MLAIMNMLWFVLSTLLLHQAVTMEMVREPAEEMSEIAQVPVAVSEKADSVVCPGHESSCPDNTTCCKTKDRVWGCCPLPDAVCCKDGEHCCPKGYTCDVSAGSCSQESETIEIRPLKPAIKESKVNLVQCNATAYCPNGNTCCRLASGEWGCCPLPNAVCCSDGVHCCPNGYTCTSSSCQRGSHEIKLFKKAPAIHVEQVVCPGGQYLCPDGNTCCRLASGEWGCCPYPNAVCCSDGVHCCPNGYTCTSSSCQRGSHVIKRLTKKPAILVNLVQCNATAYCPDGYTCCRLKSGEWGCCPYPNAVCCPDRVHCCPNGYTCTSSSCQRGSHEIKLFKKTPAIKVNLVQCNATAYCPDGYTCCRLKSGEWGCCPYSNAVCCPDRVHCCPNGYTCTSSSCQRGSHEIKLFKKTPAIKVNLVPCNATAYCPDGNTCCRLASGEWGCCPYPNAVCCSDGVHCCPNGYTCNSGQCQRGSHVIKLLTKKPAIQVEQVVCPDGQSVCPDGNTCCRLASGEWGCCPYPNAVCCPDRVHCCPNGYTCTSSSCQRGSHEIKLFKKTPAIQHKKALEVK